MARKPNTALRILVPLGAIVVGLMVVYAAFQASQNASPARPLPQAQAPDDTQAADTTADTSGDEPGSTEVADAVDGALDEAVDRVADAVTDRVTMQPAPVEASAAEAAAASEGGAPDAAGGFSVADLAPVPFDDEDLATLGDLDRESPATMRIQFSRFGAGIDEMRLAGSFTDIAGLTQDIAEPGSVEKEGHTLLQSAEIVNNQAVIPFAALWLEVSFGSEKKLVGLTRATRPDGTAASAWRQTAPGAFEAIIAGADGEPVLRVTRRYTLPDNSFDLRLTQRVENLTPYALTVNFTQFGPVDMNQESIGYGGDKRRVRFGYLPPASVNPTRQAVGSGNFLMPRRKALGDRDDRIGYAAVEPLWPNRESQKKDYELAWAALTNRYYGVAVHAVPDPSAVNAGTADKRLTGVETVDRVLADTVSGASGLAIRLNGAPVALGPNASADLDLGIYAGPLSRPVIREQPYGPPLALDRLVVYNFGGPCALCTFAFLTDILLWLLINLEKLTFDWALAIILLVVVVRTALHPITKWSQIRLQVFGKQMQEMAPKQQKLKEKYGDDPKRMQQEMAKLWREEGINPAGMLGCLPMFLQTPVWIALYATLYFSIELRHNPAFYGVFQELGGMRFLADLASPDSLIPLGTDLHIPLISGIMGPIQGINILPLLLGVVFYGHQKYLTPQTAAAMSPEQQQQQKIIRFMTVVMFPVFMYNAPSGLALYFITNSTLAIFETRHIRKSAEKKGLLDLDQMKAKRNAKRAGKPSGGFFSRLQEMAEQQQKLREMQQQQAKTGNKKGQFKPSKPDRADPSKRFKKR